MRLATVILAFGLTLGLTGTAQATCFGFRGKDIKVCVDGDDNSARRRATAVCEDVTDGSCSISGDSGSTCQRSSSVRCYDASGNEQRRITVD